MPNQPRRKRQAPRNIWKLPPNTFYYENGERLLIVTGAALFVLALAIGAAASMGISLF